MPTKTLRNVPEDMARKIKLLSERQRRSENQQFLVLLEEALQIEEKKMAESPVPISIETQVKLWRSLSGKWKDGKDAQKIIEDIYSSRTLGRDVDL